MKIIKTFENHKNQTDLELVNQYIETSLEFIHPVIFREIQNRNLYDIVNHLPKNKDEARAIAYARLAKAGKVFNDEEIDKISGVISNIDRLKKQINETASTEVVKLVALLNEMLDDANYVKDYFKKSQLPD